MTNAEDKEWKSNALVSKWRASPGSTKDLRNSNDMGKTRYSITFIMLFQSTNNVTVCFSVTRNKAFEGED